MRRFLWFIPKCPLPAQDGARVANTVLLKGLTALGEKIDLLIFAAEDEVVDFSSLREELGVRNIYVIRRSKGGIFSLLKAFLLKPLLPITVAKYTSRDVKRGVKALIDNSDTSYISEIDEIEERGNWNFILYDGLHVAAFATAYGKYNKLAKFHTIYRAHNCEADIWKLRAKQEKNLIKRLLLFYQYLRMAVFEQSVVTGVDAIATVSDDDLRILNHSNGCKNGVTVPIAQNFIEQEKGQRSSDCLSLLFVGKLDWPPNRDGLKWFLEEVWKKIVNKGPDTSIKEGGEQEGSSVDLGGCETSQNSSNITTTLGDDRRSQNLRFKLIIIGSGDGSWLKPYLELQGVDFLGKVPKLDVYYQGCDAVIVPIFYGSGTRVKVIEAASYGKACIGTELGVSGLGFVPGEHYLKAENAVEWISALDDLDLVTLEKVGRNSFDLLSKDYSIKSAANKFVMLVDRVLG